MARSAKKGVHKSELRAQVQHERSRRSTPTLGWREWIALPELDVERVKAKVDTGARTSSLHAVDIVVTGRGEHPLVRFAVHPLQRNDRRVVQCAAHLLEYRSITSSNGSREMRPVIRTDIEIDGERWPIDLTLTDRDVMGFRMLIGREAIRSRYLVDPDHSFLVRNLVPRRKKKKKKKKKKRRSP